jgi:hypothetical protein
MMLFVNYGHGPGREISRLTIWTINQKVLYATIEDHKHNYTGTLISDSVVRQSFVHVPDHEVVALKHYYNFDWIWFTMTPNFAGNDVLRQVILEIESVKASLSTN